MELVLDHIGVGVRDLDRGREAYARLGFALTPRSVHRGSLTPGGPVIAWGSANHCAMFDEGYLEIIGPSPPDATGSIRDMVERYEGAHIVAIGCEDSQKIYEAFSVLGLPVQPPRLLERDAPYGVAGGRNPACVVPQCHVRSRGLRRGLDVLHPAFDARRAVATASARTPEWSRGASRDLFLRARSRSGGRQVRAHAALGARETRAGRLAIAFGPGAARILEPDAWNRLAPDQPTPEPPAPVGIGFRVSSLDRARDRIEANGIVFRDGALPWVGANGRLRHRSVFFRRIENSNEHAMKAAVIYEHGGPGSIGIETDFPDPEAGPGDVVVKVYAAHPSTITTSSRAAACRE